MNWINCDIRVSHLTLLLNVTQHDTKVDIFINNAKCPFFFLQVHIGGHNYMFVFRDLPCNGGDLSCSVYRSTKPKSIYTYRYQDYYSCLLYCLKEKRKKALKKSYCDYLKGSMYFWRRNQNSVFEYLNKNKREHEHET